MSEFFTSRIEGITSSAPSFDYHAHRVARFVRQAEEIAKRVESQRQAEAESAKSAVVQQSSTNSSQAPKRT